MATFREKMLLLKGLLKGDTSYTGPFYVAVEITRRCNLNCLCCRCHSPDLNRPSIGDQSVKDMSVKVFDDLCHELEKMGTTHLIFTGEGEPFLHPHLFDFIAVAKRAGLSVILFTNGTFLDETRIQAILDSDLDVLKISLWACSYEGYKLNYPGGDPENFKKIIEGLKLLSRMRFRKKSNLPTINLHQPINRLNYNELDTMLALTRKTGCDCLTFSPIQTWRGQLQELALDKEEETALRSSLVQVGKQLDSFSIDHNVDNVLLRYGIGEAVWEKLPCYIGWIWSRVKPDGTVVPCNTCDLVMGDLKEKRFRDIWNDSAYRAFRRKAMTREGLESMSEYCDCGFCCNVWDSARVHKFFRWFSPFRLNKTGRK